MNPAFARHLLKGFKQLCPEHNYSQRLVQRLGFSFRSEYLLDLSDFNLIQIIILSLYSGPHILILHCLYNNKIYTYCQSDE